MTVSGHFRRRLAGALALAALIAACGGDDPPADILTEFKYGSIGTEGNVGVPYWIWVVLPEVFADKLPNRPGRGYEKLGFVYEKPDSDLPIGTSKSTDRVPLVGLNCATCHAATYRDAPGSSPKVVLGMPAHQMDLQGYARFLSAIAKDPRFNADTLLAAMRKREGRAATTLSKITWLLKLAYPAIGDKPIASIAAPELLAMLRRVEASGHYETARRLRSTCGQVLRYAIATGRADRDPSAEGGAVSHFDSAG